MLCNLTSGETEAQSKGKWLDQAPCRTRMESTMHPTIGNPGDVRTTAPINAVKQENDLGNMDIWNFIYHFFWMVGSF